MRARLIRPVSPFAAATLIPIPLLALGALLGGGFILAAFLYMTLLRMILDQLIATAGPEAGAGSEFPAADPLLRALTWSHFLLLPLGVAAVAGASGLGFWEGLAALFAFGMFFGQVSNSVAHELIHRTDRQFFRLGKWVLISLLYGHHTTAHLRIHHRYVATPDDPNSAPLGESFWAFIGRAWADAFLAGWEIEKSIAQVKERPMPLWRHPYVEYVLGGLAFAVAMALMMGGSGVIAYLMLAAYAQLQLLLSDYVQHYGLRRRRIGEDRYEQVAPWHSWNAANWFSGGLMLNAPRHSEHHTHPARPYPELSLPAADEGPRLPFSLPAMGAVALVPPLWRRLMDRRAARWQERIDEGEIERRSPPPLRPAPVKPVKPDDTAAAPGSGDAATAAASAAEAADGAEDNEGRRLMRRLAEAEVALAEEAATEVKPERRKPISERSEAAARTPDLWSGREHAAKADDSQKNQDTDAAPEREAGNGAPAARFVRSAALYQPEDDGQGSEAPAPEEAAEKDGATDETASPDRPSEAAQVRDRLPDDADLAAVTALVAENPSERPNSRRPGSRRRGAFPAIEPESEATRASARRRWTGALRAPARAARALAAVLRWSPPQPPGSDAP